MDNESDRFAGGTDGCKVRIGNKAGEALLARARPGLARPGLG